VDIKVGDNVTERCDGHLDGVLNVNKYILDALKIHIPNSKGRLGALVRSNTDKGLQVYELDLGEKMTMVMHVSWAKSKR
jgi:hypothetical protein